MAEISKKKYIAPRRTKGGDASGELYEKRGSFASAYVKKNLFPPSVEQKYPPEDKYIKIRGEFSAIVHRKDKTKPYLAFQLEAEKVWAGHVSRTYIVSFAQAC